MQMLKAAAPCHGPQELRRIRRQSAGLFAFAGLASVFVNLLMLTGPLFMLQVYDRVLGSRSEETLVALGLLVTFLFATMGLLDWARARVMSRAGARFQAGLDDRMFDAALRAAIVGGGVGRPSGELSSLAAVQQFMGSPVLLAIFDIPFAPLFAAMIFVFHPLLGWVAVAGGGLLILVTLFNQWLTRKRQEEALAAASEAEAIATDFRNGAEAVLGMGMQKQARARWRRLRDKALALSVSASDWTGSFATLSKTFRLFLQSAMLGVGAWLVLREEMTAGAMIGASILLGRALAPVEQALAGWPVAQRAIAGWRQLERALAAAPADPPRTILPEPRALLKVSNLVVTPPGERKPALSGVSFELKPGQALGVIGPSAAGKSTLARAIVAVWPVAAGRIDLDGASLEQYAPELLGRYIGYLPQSVPLFRATIAENIARMAIAPDHAAVVSAARMAGAHEMIKALPKGYDTMIGNDSRLSGGQRQLVGLARALYGEPKILVLDEPNSNLDSIGSNHVNAAIRALKERGGAAIVIAHRPAAIAECDLLLMMEAGRQKAFGPRDMVLKAQVRNVAEIRPTLNPVTKG